MRRQRCDDASDSALIENNGVAWKWCCNHFGVAPFISMREVVLVLSQRWHYIEADAWFERALIRLECTR